LKKLVNSFINRENIYYLLVASKVKQILTDATGINSKKQDRRVIMNI
jgi:hypothetical protein